MTEPVTQTLDLPGAALTFDIRKVDDDSGTPILLMIGSPMDASGFATLAEHFLDRTVVTYDPRGVGRSPRVDGATASTPDEHVEDLHRLISVLGAGAVDIFASSGGAVNALALVARHPNTVRVLVAHEPPLATVLPDRQHALAAARRHPRDLCARRSGAGDGEVHRIHDHQGTCSAQLRKLGSYSGRYRSFDRR